MPDFFRTSELSDIKESFRPAESVDLRRLPETYSRLYGTQERAEEAERELGLQQAFRGAEQQRQRELADVGGQIGTSALGARGEFLTEAGDLQRRYGLTSKEVAKAVEPEIQKRARIQDLKSQIANRQFKDISRVFNRDAQQFQRQVEAYDRTLSNRMQDEREEMIRAQDIRYDAAVESLKKKLIRRKTGGLLLGALGGIAGALTGGLVVKGGLKAISAGLRIGSGLTGGLSNLIGSRRRLSTGF